MRKYDCKIIEYKPLGKGTLLKVYVPQYVPIKKIASGKALEAVIILNDNRYLSPLQRRKIKLTIKDIAEGLGYSCAEIEKLLINDFSERYEYKLKPIAQMSISAACDFINYLIEFTFSNDIALKDYGINRTEDIDKYLYLCLKYRKCAVCGKNSRVEGTNGIHHWDTIGMGRDRRTVDDSKLKKISLCPVCHAIAENIGKIEFEKKYKVYGILYVEDV